MERLQIQPPPHVTESSTRRPPFATAESPPFREFGLPLAHESPEQSTVGQAISRGTSDLEALTNLSSSFGHPQRNGAALSPSEPGFAALAAEGTTFATRLSVHC